MGPLEGIRVVEFAGVGPGPFCGMLLSDLGAEVLRVERAKRAQASGGARPPADVLNRGRLNIGLDLKRPEGVEAALRLVETADALIEGFRPGVMERFGLGPEPCLERNPRLVYGRITGWGQEGPLAQAAGHDINYIALASALEGIGRPGEPPPPPLNLIGDFGGGGMLLAFGIVAALVDCARSGKGQVIDAAMVDGAATLMAIFYGMRATGFWSDERGVNLLDGAAPFYDTYETQDGKYISLGSIEPQFYAELLQRTGLGGQGLPSQMGRASWPEVKERIAKLIKTKRRDEWCELLEGTDVCFAPVLSMAEAPEHPHNRARGTFVEIAGVVQPAPSPRFSRTPAEIQDGVSGAEIDAVLAAWGLDAAEIQRLREQKTLV